MNEISSWKKYVYDSNIVIDIFQYFIKILKICDKEWKWDKTEFKEIWEIAKFYIGIDDEDVCRNKITLSQSKLFFICVWITKLVNKDNNLENLHDIRLLTHYNYFESIKCDSLIDIEDELIMYIEELHMASMEEPLRIFNANLSQTKISSNPQFLERYEKIFDDYNTFSYHSFNYDDCTTWQELYLLGKLNNSFDKNRKNNILENEFTDIDKNLDDKSKLIKLKEFFNNESVNFVINSLLYVSYNVIPAEEVRIKHCVLLKNAIRDGLDWQKLSSSSSYKILSYLFKDKLMDECKRNPDYIELLHELHSNKDPLTIQKLKEDGYCISKLQRSILREFLINKFKKIDNIDNLSTLIDYLKDESVTKQIDKDYLLKVDEKFAELTDQNNGIIVASAYLEYMNFLISINSNNNIDKRFLCRKMIILQKKWNKIIYKKQVDSMFPITYKQEFKKEELISFSDLTLDYPILFAQCCTPTTIEKILQIMIKTSEHPIKYLFSTIDMNPIFPMKKAIIYERHDIDLLLLDYVENIKNKYKYKFLNVLDSATYVSSIHDTYELLTKNMITIFKREEELYNTVKKNADIDLIPYSSNTSLGLLTQLFPLLEIKIRELVSLLSIFPFKKNKNEFMQYNDPSSLLRELLNMVYSEQGSFENVPDLFFVYNIMYNGNSCNIRNECIHGRDYFSGYNLKIAFRATLIAIHMVNFRIDTINKNISDLTEKI